MECMSASVFTNDMYLVMCMGVQGGGMLVNMNVLSVCAVGDKQFLNERGMSLMMRG